MTVTPPAPSTLRKYGLTLAEWQAILKRQGGTCGICKTVPRTQKLDIDHEHRRGWRRMKPEKRKLYVRGLLCRFCNYRVVRRGMTIERLRGGAEYLERYDLTQRA